MVRRILTLLPPFAAEYHKLSIPVEDTQSQDGALGQIYYRGKYIHHQNYISVYISFRVYCYAAAVENINNSLNEIKQSKIKTNI